MGILKLKKKKIYRDKIRVHLRDVDTEKVLVCNKISLGEKNCKYVISYLYSDDKDKPLHIMLPKSSAYDGQTKWTYFLIEYDELLEKI